MLIVVGLLVLSGPLSFSHPPTWASSVPNLPVARPSAQFQLAAAEISAAHGAGPGAVAPKAIPPSSPAGPNAVFSLAMTYDPRDGYVVAVTPNATGLSGNTFLGRSDETWTYAAGVWTSITTNGTPPNLLYPGLTYDAKDGYVLLFGGIEVGGPNGTMPWLYSNQTWSFVGGNWTNRTSTSVVQPYADAPVSSLAYDGADGYVVLLDQSVVGPATMTPTTWTYLNGTWQNITGNASYAMPPITGGSMAYDASDGYVVYFGAIEGTNSSNWYTENVTWKFAAGVWTNITSSVGPAPAGRVYQAMAFDPALGGVVLFGGTQVVSGASQNLADTWLFSNATWTNLHVTTGNTTWYAVEEQMAYDPGNSSLLLAGWSVCCGSQIWSLGTANWTVAAPAFGPKQVGADTGTPFELDVRNIGPSQGTLQYVYTGLPPGCLTADTPRLVCTTSNPGQYTVQVTATDTVGYSTTLRTVVTVHPAPAVSSFSASVPVGEVGYPVALTTVASGGTGSLTLRYSGLPGGCTSANTTTLQCLPSESGSFTVGIQATDEIGVSALASTSLVVEPQPSVTTLALQPTAVVDVNQSILFAALTTGGVGPFSYQFSGLPLGCAPPNAPSFACSALSPGTYRVTFRATDSFGSAAGAGATLTVNPLPSIATFAISSSSMNVGASLALSVTVVGGTSPFEFVYTGLPAGCVTSDRATLSCTAGAPGNYTVTAHVTDATGALTTRSVSIEVLPVVQRPTEPGGGGVLPGSTAGAAAIASAGLAVGVLGLVGAAVWVRNEKRARREGEAIIQELRRRVEDPARDPPRTH